MKKILATIAVLSAVICLFSCSKPGNNDSGKTPDVKEEVKPVSLSLSFVLPEGGEKTAWVAGDQIVVHGEYAKDKVTVTLAAGDISSDGKTASLTVDGLVPYVREDVGSTLYAGYPAEAVDLLDHCFFYTKFTSSNQYLLAACNDAGNKFQFLEVCGKLTFTVDGDYDSYALSGRKDAITGYEAIQVKVTDKEQNFNQYRQGPLVTISGPITSGTQTVYVPAGTEMPSGFDLKLFKGGAAVKSYTDKTETSIARGSVQNLGDITALVVDYEEEINVSDAVNLSEEEAANSYIVTAPGTYRVKSVKGNSTDAISGIETTAVIWETWNNSEEVKEKSLIDATTYEGGYIYFRVPEPFHTGNALIAALDEEGNILWSWHIWLPESAPTQSSYGYMTSPREMMSRNLGALMDTEAGAPADSRSFGLLYEWGRKDPFLGADGAGSTEKVTFVGTEMTISDAIIPLADVGSQPTVLVGVEGAWCDSNDNYLWADLERDGSKVKSIYDPCPPGYRIPARSLGAIFTGNGSAITGWYYDADNHVVQLGDPLATFPICGYMKSDGTIVPDEAVVWDSRNDFEAGTVSYCMAIADGGSKKSSKARSYACSVRCMTE